METTVTIKRLISRPVSGEGCFHLPMADSKKFVGIVGESPSTAPLTPHKAIADPAWK